MNNKNIIIAGAIAVGLYLFSQTKKILPGTGAQKVAQRIRPPAPSTIRQRTAQKIAQKVAQKVAQMDISEMPVQLLRYLVAHAAAQEKTGKEVAALKAEVARREAAWLATHKAPTKRIGQPTTQAARIAALRKAAVRKATAQKIGKKIGKTVAQKVVSKIQEETGGRTGMALVIYLQKKAAVMHAAATQAVNAAKNNTKAILPSSKWAGGRTGMALAIYLKKREEAIKRAVAQAKAAVPITRLFPGAERSKIIPYSESSKHSYYGPKSHKLQNEGYMVEWQKRHYNSIEAYHDRKEQYVLSHPEYWKK